MLTLQVHPNKGVGFLSIPTLHYAVRTSTDRVAALGSTLYEVLTRLKALPVVYPSIDISYAPSSPLTSPLVLNLPANGLRLRFDGPEQTLRLVEVLDFSHTQLSYRNVEFVKLPESHAATSVGPTFRQVYNMMGPTFPGEYLPPSSSSRKDLGSYVLSYPGIAFSFPLQSSAWNPELDHVSLLSSSAALPARSLAIYEGASWQDVRQGLLSPKATDPKLKPTAYRLKDHRADEIELVKIHGHGKLEMTRHASPSLQLQLGETTVQDLVMELGPPDAIYYKNDDRLSIHRTPRQNHPSNHEYEESSTIEEDMTDGDPSFTHSNPPTSEEEDGTTGTTKNNNGKSTADCFYNYFHHGLDVFLSHPTNPSPPFPSSVPHSEGLPQTRGAEHLVATKLILHGNVPGSYPFNRYRRIRWAIHPGSSNEAVSVINSETPFATVSQSLQQLWRGAPGSDSKEMVSQKRMVLNRGWGGSPSDSCELLGGWEESADTTKKEGSNGLGGPGSSNTELFGFPGLVFEVLKNGAVSCLTIY